MNNQEQTMKLLNENVELKNEIKSIRNTLFNRIKLKLTDGEKDYIEYVEKTTLSKYKIDEQGYIEMDVFFTIMEDLMGEISYLEDKINELEHNEDGSIRVW